VCTVYLAGKPPSTRSNTVYIYGSGQPYTHVHLQLTTTQSYSILNSYLTRVKARPCRHPLPELLVDHQDDGHDVLKGGRGRVKVWPQVILQVLRHLQQHDTLKGGWGIAAPAQFVLVYGRHELGLEGWWGLAGDGFAGPLLLCGLGQLVSVDLANMREQGFKRRYLPCCAVRCKTPSLGVHACIHAGQSVQPTVVCTPLLL